MDYASYGEINPYVVIGSFRTDRGGSWSYSQTRLFDAKTLVSMENDALDKIVRASFKMVSVASVAGSAGGSPDPEKDEESKTRRKC